MPTPIPRRTTPLPTWNAITLREVRHQLRLPQENNQFDNELSRLIQVAERTIQDEQDRVVQLGTFDWTLDGFPHPRVLRLPTRNAVDPVSIAYIDTAGDPQAFTDFTFAGDRVYPQLVTNNVVFPETRFGYAETVVITFDAGSTAAAEVPADLQQAILAIVDSLFNNCGDENFGKAYQALANRQIATYL